MQISYATLIWVH